MPGVPIEIHCHSSDHSGDAVTPAVEMVRRYHELGFGGLVFTEHGYTWPEEELAELRRKADLPPEFFLASGVEVRLEHEGMTMGDVLIYGSGETFDAREPALDVFRRLGPGAWLVAAHPGVPRGGLERRIGDYPVLAAEVWNARYGERASEAAERLAEDFGLPGVGGSDAHKLEEAGRGGTLVPRVPESLADLRAMIAEGEARPYRGRDESPSPPAFLSWLFGRRRD